MGRWLVEVEAARRGFLSTGVVVDATIGPQVLASWERSRHYGVDPNQIAPRFLGHHRDVPAVVNSADAVFEEFVSVNPDTGCSVVLIDTGGVVRARRDNDPGLGRLLDGLCLVSGYGFAERTVGTTAASVVLHEQRGGTVRGPEHFACALTCLSEAGAPVVDQDGMCRGVVAVVCHDSDHSALQMQLARALAGLVAERMADEPVRRTRAMVERFAGQARTGDEWVLATDGEYLVSNAAARRPAAEDQQVLHDVLLAGLMLEDFDDKHVDLPSGGCAAVRLEPVRVDGKVSGVVLAGARAGARRSAEVPEAVRRQGSHVAPLGRRDYAKNLREDAAGVHAEARIRANRELLSPYLRARHEMAASIRQGRNHLLIGEPGVGKRTLVNSQFRAAYPAGRVTSIDCGRFAGAADGAGRGAELLGPADGRPQIVVLHEMNLLDPVRARRLDEALRPLVAQLLPPLVVGCVDTPALDATRPYGLLLRHFHQVTRIPALRYRADEIGDIALAVLRRLSGRRSLRLSLQVIRVLEGYAWPGNISELEDVLRFVVSRKPLGEVQAPDLPQQCFMARARRMSMLESAQCDAIIQALYEAGGNRYKAAAMLGIARSSLYRKIDAFGISYIA